MKRLVVMALAFALALPLVVLVALSSPVHAQNAALRLPDLRMGEVQYLKLRKSPDGRRLLRFSAIIVNVGAGPFELHGQRSAWRPYARTMSVTQRIYEDAGGYRDVPTAAIMFYSGDGHDHWHVKNLQRYTLRKLGGGRVREGAKEGFCFFDSYLWNGTLPGSPERKHYLSGRMCGELQEQDALQAKIGLSVGWADVYQYYLPFQWIDITGLPSGRYRLNAVADKKDIFEESREANNHTWVTIELKGDRVRVLRYGPSAPYCGPTGQWC